MKSSFDHKVLNVQNAFEPHILHSCPLQLLETKKFPVWSCLGNYLSESLRGCASPRFLLVWSRTLNVNEEAKCHTSRKYEGHNWIFDRYCAWKVSGRNRGKSRKAYPWVPAEVLVRILNCHHARDQWHCSKHWVSRLLASTYFYIPHQRRMTGWDSQGAVSVSWL